MNAPVSGRLADNLVSADVAGKAGLHKSANKEDLAAAKSQEFSNLLFAAREKDSSIPSSPSQADLEKKLQDAKADAATDAESAEVEATASKSVVLLPTLNPDPVQPLPTSHAASPSIKGAQDSAESRGAGETAKAGATSEKAAAGSDINALTPLSLQAMLPASLASMFPELPKLGFAIASEGKTQVGSGAAKTTFGDASTAKPELTMATGEKVAMDKFDGGTFAGAKATWEDAATDKSGAEKAGTTALAAAAQGQQGAFVSRRIAGDAGTVDASPATSGAATGVPGVDSKLTASAVVQSADDSAGMKGALAGASSVTNSSAAATAQNVARDPDAISNAIDLDAKQAASTGSSGLAVDTSLTATAVPSSHDVTAASVIAAAVHEVPAGPVPQLAPTAHEGGAQALRMDGVERSSSSSSGLGNADAHALLDGAGATSAAGREGTWQISANRVEAGFANGQDSWTSVVAQRQQGHVTAMLELGSAAEHSSATSMLPQLNAHLAERQLPVDQLGVSVRQQFSDKDASPANQGEQSGQAPQSQRGQQAGIAALSSVAATPAEMEGSRTIFEGNRISIRA